MGRGLRERKDLRRKCRFTKGKAPWTMIILAMALTMSGLSACNPAAGRAVGTDVQGTDHPESGPEGDGMKGMDGSGEEGMDGSNEEPSESYDTAVSYTHLFDFWSRKAGELHDRMGRMGEAYRVEWLEQLKRRTMISAVCSLGASGGFLIWGHFAGGNREG